MDAPVLMLQGEQVISFRKVERTNAALLKPFSDYNNAITFNARPLCQDAYLPYDSIE